MRVSLRFLQRADEFLHLICRVLRHPVADVSVGVEREGDGCVSEGQGKRLKVDFALNGKRGIGVPLRYNYDKPEKPRISRVFGYLARFFILFQTEKSSREVVIS